MHGGGVMVTDIMLRDMQWTLLCALVCVQHAFYCCHSKPRVIMLWANQYRRIHVYQLETSPLI